MESVLDSKKAGTYTRGFKAVCVMVSAFSTGFMWRVRGDGGWGSMWGMFAVATVLCLLIFFVFGHRKKAGYEFLPLYVIGMAVTVGGWGTLNKQISGVMNISSQVNGETVESIIRISPISGLAIMLMLGFCWIPFFAYLMGRFFSGREYKVREFIIPFIIFYGVVLIFKASLAHPIFSIINPQAVDLFRSGLLEQGLEARPWLMYMQNFDSDPWAKTIMGGRNYFTSIEVVASAFAALAVWIYQRFILKDKIGGRINLSINVIMALSITIANVFLVLTVKEGILGHVNAPSWLTRQGWSFWEFFTGFLLGLGLMLLFFAADKKTGAHINVKDSLPKLPKKISYLYHTVLTLGFVFFMTLIRPFSDRLLKTEYTLTGRQIFYTAGAYNEAISTGADPANIYLYEGHLPSNASLYIIFIVFALIISALIVSRNMGRRGLDTPVNLPFSDFCVISLLIYFTAVVFLYFLTGGMYLVRPEFSPVTLLMQISALLVYLGLGMMLFEKYRSAKVSS